MPLAVMTCKAAESWLQGLEDRIHNCHIQDLPAHNHEYLRDSIMWQMTDRARYTLNAAGELCIKLDSETGFEE